ncbi:MAG: hypothetical protein CBD77_02775 [bacterium TMED217]|nr:MAG: hypothetical protein CBD77_02775 [bacterium TMED217]
MIMYKNRINTIKLNFLILICFFFGCTINDSEEDSSVYISDTQFNFHQNENNLYVSTSVLPDADGKILDNVLIEWFGTDLQNKPDSLTLEDSGMNGDIIAGDNYYTLKFNNDSTVINNTLGDDSGSVYLNILAIYVGQMEKESYSYKIGNIIPRITSVSSPDTIVRESSATLSLYLVSATVFDADGLDDIKWVGFTSYHVEGDSMMNGGNYIYLYDDGSENIIYSPDITSGDLNTGDGTYSFKIPVFGSGNIDPEYQTKTGTFRWEFIAQDNEDEYSLTATHEVIIQ